GLLSISAVRPRGSEVSSTVFGHRLAPPAGSLGPSPVYWSSSTPFQYRWRSVPWAGNKRQTHQCLKLTDSCDPQHRSPTIGRFPGDRPLEHPMPRQRARLLIALPLIVLLAAGLAACDFPSGLASLNIVPSMRLAPSLGGALGTTSPAIMVPGS